MEPDKEQLAMLRRSVREWNAWRSENPEIRPNLEGATLCGVALTGANLSGANLVNANMVNADLSGADLGDANLGDANLRLSILYRADLENSNLFGADLSRANLHAARLARATLSVTNLTGTDLEETNFDNAILDDTNFSDVDLSGVKNLDKVIHDGPSTVDWRTLERSGQLPPKFLLGVGFPQIFIDSLPSLIDASRKDPQCFISYTHADGEFAKKLYDDLVNQGIRCWLDSEELQSGDYTRRKIHKEIRDRDRVILVLSEESIQSDWVRREVEWARNKEIEEYDDKVPVLAPIRITEGVLEAIDRLADDASKKWAKYLKKHRHIGDFRGWCFEKKYQAALARLTCDLQGDQVEKFKQQPGKL